MINAVKKVKQRWKIGNANIWGRVSILIVSRVIREGLTKKVTFEQSHLDIGEKALQVE